MKSILFKSLCFSCMFFLLFVCLFNLSSFALGKTNKFFSSEEVSRLRETKSTSEPKPPSESKPEPEPPTQNTKSEDQTLNEKTEEKTSNTDSEIKSSAVITRQVANDTSTSVWLYIGIGGGVLVFAAGGVTAYILIRRKKSGFC